MRILFTEGKGQKSNVVGVKCPSAVHLAHRLFKSQVHPHKVALKGTLFSQPRIPFERFIFFLTATSKPTWSEYLILKAQL